MRYLLINADGIIENAIDWDGVTEYPLPDGYQLVQSDKEGVIGELWA